MDFIFAKWGKFEYDQLERHLFDISYPENAEWENKIVKTSYPLLSAYTKDLRAIAKSIFSGNYLDFIANNPHRYHEELLLDCFVISLIKDSGAQMKSLSKYLRICDSWAQTDSLKFYITKKNEDDWFNYAISLTKSSYVFERRCGILIFFKFLTSDKLNIIFDTLKSLKNESEYYVNMAIAWLVCDAFIKRRNETINFLNSNSLSNWVRNKAISKCRDSYRVSKDDKKMLLSLKKQNVL